MMQRDGERRIPAQLTTEEYLKKRQRIKKQEAGRNERTGSPPADPIKLAELLYI